MINLDSVDAVERFMDLWQEPDETTRFFKKAPRLLGEYYEEQEYPARCLVFIYDTEEYETELKFLKHAARESATRWGLRFGLVTDHKLIKKYKAKHGNFWFLD